MDNTTQVAGLPGEKEANGTAPWLLALDTSTGQTGIALTDGQRMLELSLPGGREQTRSVLPEIAWSMERLQVTREQVGAVAVATGPGSFTGLRVGLSIAKGFALAQGAEVIGVPTLDVATWAYRASQTPVMAVLPAGRSRLVWSSFTGTGEAAAPRNGTLPELLGAIRDMPEALVVGELDAAVWQVIAQHHPRIESHLLGTRRSAALADLGYRRWQAGDTDDATTLEPVYLHGPQTALPPRSQR